ncbi:MAG TPA: hypothetical protein DCF44_04260 [Chitinophagaceae bacterium]|nr:hypothetical protein [Chitinophagaceae bacterium]
MPANKVFLGPADSILSIDLLFKNVTQFHRSEFPDWRVQLSQGIYKICKTFIFSRDMRLSL